MIYQLPGASEALMQGDILDDCPLLVWDELPDNSSQGKAITIRTRVVVLTQACDLAGGKAESVLVAAVHAASQMVEYGTFTAKYVRDQIRPHRVYGWYFLPIRRRNPGIDRGPSQFAHGSSRDSRSAGARWQAGQSDCDSLSRAHGAAFFRNLLPHRPAGAVSK